MAHRTNHRTYGQPDTARELIQPVNKRAIYQVKDLCIEVEILDTRYSWGQTHYLITPASGPGSQWVASGLTLRE